MIERHKIASIVKTSLPCLGEEVVDRIADDVIRDVESIAHSLIRRIIVQEREQLYRDSLKN
jgi:hypothetical protein